MEYFLPQYVPCIQWSSKRRREGRTGKHIFAPTQVQYTEQQLEAGIHTDRLTGTQHSLGESASSAGMLLGLTDSDCAACFYPECLCVGPHLPHTGKETSLQHLWHKISPRQCIHLCIIRGSRLHENKQLSSLPSLIAVKCIWIEGLAQIYSTFYSPSHSGSVHNYFQLFGYPNLTAVVWFFS